MNEEWGPFEGLENIWGVGAGLCAVSGMRYFGRAKAERILFLVRERNKLKGEENLMMQILLLFLFLNIFKSGSHDRPANKTSFPRNMYVCRGSVETKANNGNHSKK